MGENKTKKVNSSNKGILGRLLGMSNSNLLLLITVVIFVVMYAVAAGVFGGSFAVAQGFFNILNANAGLIILACGLSIVMITGGIDISVGGITGLITMCCAVLLDRQGGNIFTSILLAIAIGAAFGAVQGYFVAYLGIQPFIVTLAGMFFARGLTTIVNVEPMNVMSEQFKALKNARIIIPGLGYYNKRGIYIDAEIELGVVVAIAVVIVLFLLLRYTKLGRAFYAVGGNEQSALMLGINVKRTRFLSQLLCGILAGIGGFVYFLHVGSGAVTNGQGAEMNAIASSIIGGTMLTGGVGNIIGTLFGVLSLSTIKTIVSSVGLDQAWWTGITVAAMLCIFLIVQSIVVARKKNR